MLDKIIRPTARNIKMTKAVLLGCAIGAIIGSFSFFGEAGNFSNSSYYYWSSAVRSIASTLTFVGVIFLILGLIALGLGIRLWILEKNGKVCPKCERVYLPTETACPVCSIDLIHAMRVKEYLLNKPKVAPKTSVTENPPAADNGAPNTGEKRFCSSCGQKITQTTAFYPKCGKKVQ